MDRGRYPYIYFAVSGALETYAMNKSHREISALMNLQPEEAWLVRGGFEPMKVSVSTLQIGDHLLIKPVNVFQQMVLFSKASRPLMNQL